VIGVLEHHSTIVNDIILFTSPEIMQELCQTLPLAVQSGAEHFVQCLIDDLPRHISHRRALPDFGLLIGVLVTSHRDGWLEFAALVLNFVTKYYDKQSGMIALQGLPFRACGLFCWLCWNSHQQFAATHCSKVVPCEQNRGSFLKLIR
jgi:hypothetical protein